MPRCERALETAARRYFEMSARGDTAALQQNSIAAVAASFAGIEAAVKENQAAFTGRKSNGSAALFADRRWPGTARTR